MALYKPLGRLPGTTGRRVPATAAAMPSRLRYVALRSGSALPRATGAGSAEWQRRRELVDRGASAVHTVLLIVICAVNSGADRWGSAAGVSLILMQVVAIWAHLFYWINLTETARAPWMQMLFWKLDDAETLRNRRNLYKWLEYAVSATLGTVAVFLSSGDQPTNTLLLLITLSATIQTVGYTLDQVDKTSGSLWPEIVQWLSALSGQVVDFIVVGSAVSEHWSGSSAEHMAARAAHIVPYVLGWTAFGVWALWVLFKYAPGDGNDDFVEFWYSLLSLVAKAAVFGSTGFYLGWDPATRA